MRLTARKARTPGAAAFPSPPRGSWQGRLPPLQGRREPGAIPAPGPAQRSHRPGRLGCCSRALPPPLPHGLMRGPRRTRGRAAGEKEAPPLLLPVRPEPRPGGAGKARRADGPGRAGRARLLLLLLCRPGRAQREPRSSILGQRGCRRGAGSGRAGGRAARREGEKEGGPAASRRAARAGERRGGGGGALPSAGNHRELPGRAFRPCALAAAPGGRPEPRRRLRARAREAGAAMLEEGTAEPRGGGAGQAGVRDRAGLRAARALAQGVRGGWGGVRRPGSARWVRLGTHIDVNVHTHIYVRAPIYTCTRTSTNIYTHWPTHRHTQVPRGAGWQSRDCHCCRAQGERPPRALSPWAGPHRAPPESRLSGRPHGSPPRVYRV